MFKSVFTFVFLLLLSAQAALVEVVVDDSQGDPLTGAQVQYSASGWQKSPCDVCRAKPEASRVDKGSWHDGTGNHNGTGPLSASIAFKGTKISVQTIRTGSELSSVGVLGLDADFYFFIDGSLVNNFNEAAPTLGGDGFQYGFTVYSNDSLIDGSHQFTIQAGHAGGPETLLLLDSFKYSYDDGISSISSSSQSSPTTSSSSTDSSHDSPRNHSSHTAIIASVAAVVGVMAISLAIFLYIYCRRRRRYRTNSSFQIEALHINPAPAATVQFIHAGAPKPYTNDAPRSIGQPISIPIPSRATSSSVSTTHNGVAAQNEIEDTNTANYSGITLYPRDIYSNQRVRNMGSFTFTDNKPSFTTKTLGHSTTSFAGPSGSALDVGDIENQRSNLADDGLDTPPPYSNSSRGRR